MQQWSSLPSQRWLAPVVFATAAAMVMGFLLVRWCLPQCRRGTAARYGSNAGALASYAWLRHGPFPVIGLLLGTAMGTASALWQAQHRLDDGLAWSHHDVVSRLTVRIADLPQGDGQSARLLGDVDDPRPAGLPSRVFVTWHAQPGASLPELKPGQVWRMALVLRQPHGARNPHGYDAEGRMFAMGVRATGNVRGVPRLLGDEPWHRVGIVIERVRHWMREGMRQALGDRRYAPVLIALAIGDQAAVARDDWRVFNRSGITHLVSISGMHVTLIAAVGGVAAAFLWRRLRWRRVRLAEYLPAQVVGAAVALWVALWYCLLAGWGVPARRTFFMLAVVAVAAMARLPLSPSRILAQAAAAVSLLDPWSVLAPGFWLSFGAVAILLRVAAAMDGGGRRETLTWRARCKAMVVEFGWVQSTITLGLVPLLAYMMQQVSLASPLVNVYAIPVVSFLVTPLALACAVLSAIPGLQGLAQGAGILGHAIFDAMMVPVIWMGTSDWAVWDVAAAPWPWLVLALFGVAWAVQPSGLPLRPVAWLLILPMLCWRPERPAPGYWRLTALDVGQGSAIVIETATQVWLFDTGPMTHQGNDAGERVVVPFLRARGYRHLNGMVVSHADMDHAGGVRSVLSAFAVDQLYASFDFETFIRKQIGRANTLTPRLRTSEGGWNFLYEQLVGKSASFSRGDPRMPQSMSRCQAGQYWDADGVQFRFLHPVLDIASDSRGNARSCVLLIRGAGHSVLLPGDIGVAQERRLALEMPHVDVVMAPHHGSKTSSGDALVQATRAQHVVAQVGYMNRFGHPAPVVQARWIAAGSTFWRTDRHGAMAVASTPKGLRVQSQAQMLRRYWHRELR